MDRERHTNLNPNQQANPTRKQMSGGVISGVDWSRLSVSSNTEGFQLGFFSGYNNTRSKFTDTIGTKPQNNNSLQTVATTDSRQDIDGAFLGLYGSYILNRFSMDLAFKIDLFDMNQQRTEQVIGCGAQAPVTTIANTAMTNYTVASNANYRFDLASNLWLEPTVGVRYTKTDFGSNATALGVTDGDAFRVQGGLRLGTSHYRPNGWRLSHSITGLLYSDVAIDGYVVPSTVIGYTTPLVDEGKLRVMGILETKLDIGGGMTFYGDVEARGGKDVVGLGGRLGVRYQW